LKKYLINFAFFYVRTIEHIFGYLVEIKGLQQWHGKFDPIEFDTNILECE